MRKGVYKEKIVVPESKINISLIGQEGAILSYDDYAQKKNCFGGEKELPVLLPAIFMLRTFMPRILRLRIPRGR